MMISTSITLEQILTEIKENSSVIDKINIARTHSVIGEEILVKPNGKDTPVTVPIGDDCAAIPDENGGYLLMGAEGIIPEFVKKDPWFAGYSAIMVNISDVCSMGGLPIAVTDVLWAENELETKEIWRGMKAASEAYNVPIVGGHTCYNSNQKHLSVSILGKAKALIDSYSITEGDHLMMAIDLNGAYYENYPFWNCSTSSDSKSLLKKMHLPYQMANNNWCKAGKDISMGGLFGTLQMLVNTSGKGVEINLDALPNSPDGDLIRWLLSFPSYGYLWAVSEKDVSNVKNLFEQEGVFCNSIGTFTSSTDIYVNYEHERLKF